MRIRRPLQGLPRERSGASRNHAGRVDSGRLLAVWTEAALPAGGHFPGVSFLQVEPESSRLGEAHAWVKKMGEMKRAIARENEERQKSDRFLSTLVIAASIIAAIRLAREPDITRPTPRLLATVSDSIQLARTILNRIVR